MEKFEEKFISYEKSINRFTFQYKKLGILKIFEFLDDAIIYRDVFCFENDIDID